MKVLLTVVGLLIAVVIITGHTANTPQLINYQGFLTNTGGLPSDGTFDIEFVAKPDPKVPEKQEPTFRFTVYADVTDSAGTVTIEQSATIKGDAINSTQIINKHCVARCGFISFCGFIEILLLCC